MDKNNILPSRKAAEALAFLDWMCIDMGDSHVEQVRELCDLAKTKFPEDADDIGTEALIKFATEAYEECLKEKLIDTLSTNLSYYDDCIDFIMQQILDDMNNESEDGTYEFRGIRIHLSR